MHRSSFTLPPLLLVVSLLLSRAAVTVRALEANNPVEANNQPWSRSLPSQVATGFPVSAYDLLFAQDVTLALHAFDVVSGAKQWSLQLPDLLFPYVLEDHHSQTEGPRMVLFQSLATLYAINHHTGKVLWALGGFGVPQSPAYLPIWSHRADTILTLHEDVVTHDPGLLSGVDATSGAIAWQHKAFFPLCRDYPSGLPMPVQNIGEHFVGCFFNSTAQLNTVVQITLRSHFPLRDSDSDHAQPPIDMKIFDFSPRTVVMTPHFQFVNFKSMFDRHHRHHCKDGGRTIKHKDGVSFFVSRFYKEHANLQGVPSLVTIDTAAGNVTVDAHLMPLGISNALTFATGTADGALYVSDDNTLLALDSLTGKKLWLSTLPLNASLANKTVKLGQVRGLRLSEALVYSQEVLGTSRRGPPAVRFATVDPNTGVATHAYVDATGSLTVSSIVATGKLFLPGTNMVVAYNAASGHLLERIPTSEPVFQLDPVMNKERLVFGTKFAIFSFPLG
jgi:outer membrane protein assembly factor BamB